METPFDLVLQSQRVVAPDGVGPRAVGVTQGRIAALLPHGSVKGAQVTDVGAHVLLPGLVDSHAHINEPGRTEWEGFSSATRAAAAGGITAVVDMPLNCIPVTTSALALKTKLVEARRDAFVDLAFWGGVVPGNAGELEAMIDLGVRGFKAFLVHSGIDDFPHATEADLRLAMPILARRKIPLLVHAELDDAVPDSKHAANAYAGYLASRPESFETRAIQMMIRLAEETGCHVHVVHLSAASALPDIRAAKARGVPFSVETCPHYLVLTAEEIGAGKTEFKCAPPIREATNRAALWRGLLDGTIDLVVSDHSPCTPALKCQDTGDFGAAWGGIASLQLGLPLIWTEAQKHGATFTDIVRWMSAQPARLAGMPNKGAIKVGNDADFVVFDPEARDTVEGARLFHRHKITPYAGRDVTGRVMATYLRGERIFSGGACSTSVRGELWTPAREQKERVL